MLITAVVSVAIGIPVSRAKRQADALSFLRDRGATISYGYYGKPAKNSWIPSFHSVLEVWLGQDALLTVDEITIGAPPEHANRLRQLYSKINDRDLALIAQIKRLKVLELSCTNVTEDGARWLRTKVPTCFMDIPY